MAMNSLLFCIALDNQNTNLVDSDNFLSFSSLHTAQEASYKIGTETAKRNETKSETCNAGGRDRGPARLRLYLQLN